MRITHLYRFGIAVSGVQCVVALLAAVLTVAGKATEAKEGVKDYPWIMAGMSLATVVLGIGASWLLLLASKASCAGDHIILTFSSSLLKIIFLIAVPFIFSTQESGFRSACVNTGFTLWCTPFIMFIIGPIVEITALFFAAYTIRRRAIIKHGRDELPVLPQPPQPPQPPVYRPAWETAPVAELNLPLSLEKLESHVSGLSVRTIYWLAFALLIIAGLCSGVAALLKPFPHDDDDDGDGDGDKNTRGMTYLEFCRLSFFYLAVSAFWWLSLICMSRQKASKDERAGDHVGYATYNGLGRLFYFFVFICLRRRSETFSKVISFCTSHAFRQLECVPLGTFVVIPFVDSFIFFSVAVIVCRRAVALYGTARVLVEPEPTPDPKPIPAWKMGKVIDLDLPVAAKNETEEADEALELDPLVPSSVDSASPSP